MDWDPNNFRAMVEYMDGVGFMKSMVTFLEQCHILNCGNSYSASDGKRTYMKFGWDGDDLLMG